MSARLTDLVREIYDRTVLTKRVAALTGGTNAVGNVVITNGGTGYSASFAVTFTGGGGASAAGTATAVGGVIVEVTITTPGTGYTSPPTPVFTAGGGASGAGTAILSALTLDAIPTVSIETGTLALLVIVAATAYIYALVAGTDAESSPAVIRPDDYAGGTNEKVWKLQASYVNGFTILDGTNLALGSTTGTKIATATTQKLGFWNVTPVVQPAAADQAAVTLGNTDGEIAGLTFSVSPTQLEVEALRDKCEELGDDIRALTTLVHALRTAGVGSGIWKGAA